MTAASFTSVTATPGIGFMRQRLTNCRWALPAPTSTTCFAIGGLGAEDFIRFMLTNGRGFAYAQSPRATAGVAVECERVGCWAEGSVGHLATLPLYTYPMSRTGNLRHRPH